MTAGEVSNTSPRLSETKDSNPYAYTLEILTITNNEGISMDVRNMMGECKIFEAITNNFLMGELIIIDSITPPLFKQLLFTGQESLRIKFRMGGDEGNPHNFPSIDKLFTQSFEKGSFALSLSLISFIQLSIAIYLLSKTASELKSAAPSALNFAPLSKEFCIFSFSPQVNVVMMSTS